MYYNLVRPSGFEPLAPGFGNLYSIQLSYGRKLVMIPSLRRDIIKFNVLRAFGKRKFINQIVQNI